MVVFINQSNARPRSMSLGLMESLLAAKILKKSNDNVRDRDKKVNDMIMLRSGGETLTLRPCGPLHD